MSRKKRDSQHLMHWCKNGDMVLKNKVKDTILRENVHEERSLDSTLSNLNKHQNQKQRQLINKRLQFAKGRQRSLDKISELQPRQLRTNRSYSVGAIDVEGTQNLHEKKFNAKLKWQKAITVVRFAAQTKSGDKRTRPRAASFLPNLFVSGPKDGPKSSPRNSCRNVDDNHLVLPQIETEKKNCLEDPRFLRLQQILSFGEEKELAGNGNNSVKKREENGRGGSRGRFRSQTFHL